MMNTEQESDLWNNYKAAWGCAERLQSKCDDDSLLFGVVYDIRQGQWLLNCIDTSQWVTERFNGGHRAYFAELWREH